MSLVQNPENVSFQEIKIFWNGAFTAHVVWMTRTQSLPPFFAETEARSRSWAHNLLMVFDHPAVAATCLRSASNLKSQVPLLRDRMRNGGRVVPTSCAMEPPRSRWTPHMNAQVLRVACNKTNQANNMFSQVTYP